MFDIWDQHVSTGGSRLPNWRANSPSFFPSLFLSLPLPFPSTPPFPLPTFRSRPLKYS